MAGVGGSTPVITSFPRGGYICAHFHTVANANGLLGNFSNPSLVQGPNLTMAISRRGGDFASDLPTPGCVAANVPTADSNMVRWKFTANAPGSYCNLQVDSDYYVNLMFTEAGSDVECFPEVPICRLGSVSYHN